MATTEKDRTRIQQTRRLAAILLESHDEGVSHAEGFTTSRFDFLRDAEWLDDYAKEIADAAPTRWRQGMRAARYYMQVLLLGVLVGCGGPAFDRAVVLAVQPDTGPDIGPDNGTDAGGQSAGGGPADAAAETALDGPMGSDTAGNPEPAPDGSQNPDTAADTGPEAGFPNIGDPCVPSPGSCGPVAACELVDGAAVCVGCYVVTLTGACTDPNYPIAAQCIHGLPVGLNCKPQGTITVYCCK